MRKLLLGLLMALLVNFSFSQEIESLDYCNCKDKIDQAAPEDKWTKVGYNTSGVFIKTTREDEATSYFVGFSNKDILYVYQRMTGLEVVIVEFEIVTCDSSEYNEVFQYMNENWVEDVVPGTS